MQRKLLFWCRLNKMPEETWARKALDECFLNAWTSKYKTEIQALLGKCLIDPSSKPNKVVKAISKFTHRTEIAKIIGQRGHSLKYFPHYPTGMGRQEYISYNEESSTISKFRLGNADLGNRDNPPILECPACSNGPNDAGGAKVARNFSYSPATPSYAIRSLPKLVRNYRKPCLISLKMRFSCKICRTFFHIITLKLTFS